MGGGGMSKKRLTIKEKKFADNYVETGNASRSYKDAGYKWKTDVVARVEGYKLLQRPHIQDYIEEKMKEIEDETISSAKEVLEFLSKVMNGEITEEVINTVMTGEGHSQIVKTDKQPALKDSIKAAELLGKRYALWVERTEVEHTGQVQFVDDIGADEDESED